MKIKNCEGEYAFKALYRQTGKIGWLLSEIYFLSQEEVDAVFPEFTTKWPVEVFDDGLIYIPSGSDLE